MKNRRFLILPLITLIFANLACYLWGPVAGNADGTSGPVVATPSNATQPPSDAPDSTPIPTTERETVSPTTAAADLSTIQLELIKITTDISHPVDLTHAGDGSGLIFVVEKQGRIRILENGEIVDTPYLDITDRVGSSGSEQGFLGLAFHPDYENNRQLFVNYTDLDGNTVIARYTANEDGRSADAGSEEVIIYQPQPASNHNGGQIAFGPDGYLYIAFGDGGGAGDSFGNGQNGASFLGSMLRIDVDSDSPYAIPPDNPFVDDDEMLDEIWMKGLRNPWRFSFDSETGEMYIGDVGQNQWEEINVAPAGVGGQNYGWPAMEGFHCSGSSCAQYDSPVAEYDHGDGCSITSGYVYRGSQFPTLVGTFFFSDYCSGIIWGLNRDAAGNWQVAKLLDTEIQLSSFGVDEAGEMYALDLGGAIHQLTTGD